MEDEPRPKLLLTILEAAERLSCGRSTVYELLNSGELESVHVGRLHRIPADAVEEYVERLRDRATTLAGRPILLTEESGR